MEENIARDKKKKAEGQSKPRPTLRSKACLTSKTIVCFVVISVTLLLKKKKPMDRHEDVGSSYSDNEKQNIRKC